MRNPSRMDRITKIAICVGILTWGALHIALAHLGKSLTFTIHKYPPDLFYFSYGIAFTGCLLLLYKKLEKRLSGFTGFITFISRRAYMIFFTHYIVLDAVTTQIRWSWWQESIVITLISLAIVFIWEIASKKLQRQA